ncbi:MAG: alpha/beta hydrolase fold domain-containing protein [Nevskiaceae bacterium]
MRPFFFLLLTLACTGCSQHAGKPSQPGPAPVHVEFEISRDLTYTPVDWPKPLLADVYRPLGAGPFPSVLLLHGGAWKRGDRDQVEGLAGRIAERGYLVVSATYRLVPEHVWPTQLRDVQQALRWMHSSEGAARGVDPARIGTFGYSAGGHLAALLGGMADEPQGSGPGLAVKAVVAGGTPSDLPAFCDGKLVPAFIGKPCTAALQSYQDASPIRHVSTGDPPVFIYHGGFDTLVPIDQAERYKAALDAAGVTTEFFVIRGHGHITAFLVDGAAVDAALDFLDRYLR